MTIDHGTFINIRAGIHVHRWHANYTWRNVDAVANTRATGNDSNVLLNLSWSNGVCIFIKEFETRSSGLIDQFPHSKAKENSLLHPRVYLPGTSRRLLRCANLAAIQRSLELFKYCAIIGCEITALSL